MIHICFKFLKIGAQSGIVLSLMGDWGCGGLLGGNANVTGTLAHCTPPPWEQYIHDLELQAA